MMSNLEASTGRDRPVMRYLKVKSSRLFRYVPSFSELA